MGLGNNLVILHFNDAHQNTFDTELEVLWTGTYWIYTIQILAPKALNSEILLKVVL